MILQHEPPKIEIVKIHEGDYKAIEVRQNRDGVDIDDVIEALNKFRDQKFIGDALLQRDIEIYAAIKQYYHLVGTLSAAQYLMHKSSKPGVKLTSQDKFNIASVFKFYDEQITLDKDQAKAYKKLKLILQHG